MEPYSFVLVRPHHEWIINASQYKTTHTSLTFLSFLLKPYTYSASLLKSHIVLQYFTDSTIAMYCKYQWFQTYIYFTKKERKTKPLSLFFNLQSQCFTISEIMSVTSERHRQTSRPPLDKTAGARGSDKNAAHQCYHLLSSAPVRVESSVQLWLKIQTMSTCNKVSSEYSVITFSRGIWCKRTQL